MAAFTTITARTICITARFTTITVQRLKINLSSRLGHELWIMDQLITALPNHTIININRSTMSNNRSAKGTNETEKLTMIVCKWLGPSCRVPQNIINSVLS